ncbi:MAG TPA: cytochrome P450 [Pseudonocardia sp.]|jgi:cytochrome P450|nr:cytochrome P450 [Pseudonocardia sp.]
MLQPAGYQPGSPEFVSNPYPAFEALRAGPPASWDEATGQWVVSRHPLVDRLLRDRRLGRTYLHVAEHAEFGRPPEPDYLRPFWATVRNGMLDREPPDHTRLRRLVSAAFTARRVRELAPRIAELAGALVGDVLDAGSDGSPVDLVAVLAEPLPVTVIAELLGVPEADRWRLRPWSAAICRMFELDADRADGEAASAACLDFGDYLGRLAARRRADPADDLLTALTQVADADGDRLSSDELAGTCVLLLNAGHEATVNATGNGVWALLRHPDQHARLRADPDGLLAPAVEEMLRYDCATPMFERWALSDLAIGPEAVGDIGEVAASSDDAAPDGTVPVRRGAEVALLLGSANRDPAVFTDPDRFDVGRTPNPHLTFGAGIHFCLGAPLARAELAASVGALVQRVPKLAPVTEPAYKPGFVVRGLRSLPVSVR